MATSQAKPQLGDLIEINRGPYQHWGIYDGDGFIIHLAPPSECAAAGASSFMSIMQDKAVVKREKLCHVAGSDTCFINNLLDEKYKPLPVQDILQAARYFVGKVLSYNVATSNCEHFVTKLRYGKPVSLQVQNAVEKAAAGSLAAVVVGALVIGIFSPGSEEKKRKQ